VETNIVIDALLVVNVEYTQRKEKKKTFLKFWRHIFNILKRINNKIKNKEKFEGNYKKWKQECNS